MLYAFAVNPIEKCQIEQVLFCQRSHQCGESFLAHRQLVLAHGCIEEKKYVYRNTLHISGWTVVKMNKGVIFNNNVQLS